MFVVKEIEPDLTYPMRHRILRPHQTLKEVMYDTDFDEEGFHVGAFIGKELISIVSFCAERHPDYLNKKQLRLRAMATHEDYRKLGAGRAVVVYGEEVMKDRGYDFLWCKGRTPVQAYYEKLGFTAHGEPYDYPGIGMHIDMIKELK